jgi:hypothetical protein
MAKHKMKRTYGGANYSIADAFGEFLGEKGLYGRAEQTLENYKRSVDYFLKDNELTYESPIESIDKEAFLRWIAIMHQKEMNFLV